jgi:hypothetical protein
LTRAISTGKPGGVFHLRWSQPLGQIMGEPQGMSRIAPKLNKIVEVPAAEMCALRLQFSSAAAGPHANFRHGKSILPAVNIMLRPGFT